MRSRLPLLPLLLLPAAGCFVGVPSEPAGIAPGSELTIELTANGQDRLLALASRRDDRVSGRLLALTTDSLTISTRLAPPAGMAVVPNLRRPLSFARVDIDGVTVPELSRGRTAAAVAALVAVATFVAIQVFDIGGSTGPEGPPPPTPTPAMSRR